MPYSHRFTGHSKWNLWICHFQPTSMPRPWPIFLIFAVMCFCPRIHAQVNSAADIERLEQEVSLLSSEVCGATEPTEPNAKASFDEQKKLLTVDAHTLTALLDQHKANVSLEPNTSLENTTLLNSIGVEEKALSQECPSLPDEIRKALPGNAVSPQEGSPSLSVTPRSISFTPAQPLQTESAPQTVSVTNSSSATVTLADLGLTLSSTNAFRISENTCTTPLAVKGTCSFKVSYVPFAFSSTEDKAVLAILPISDLPRYQQLNSASESQLLQAGYNVVSLSGTAEHWKYPLARGIVGLALAAPTSTAIKQSYLIDFDLLGPLPFPWPLSKVVMQNEDPLENRFWGWFNPRITSLPSATNFSALNTITQSGSFLSGQINQATLNIVQGVDVNGGFELVLVKPRDGIPWWAEYSNTKARLSTSLIAGLGISTPFSTNTADVLSVVNQSICDAFGFTPTLTSPPKPVKCIPAPSSGTTPPTSVVLSVVTPTGTTTDPFIDFVTPERSRFFRRLYAGFRIKTFFFSDNIEADCDPKRSDGKCAAPYNIFPGVIDLSVGKDEGVTGGAMSTWLFRLEASYPLPFYPGFHIFGSIYTGLGSNKNTAPVNSYSIQSPSPGANNDLNTFRLPVTPPNRDYFSVGIGVDLIQVFKKASNGGQPSGNAPAPPTSQNSSPQTKTTPPPAGQNNSGQTNATGK